MAGATHTTCLLASVARATQCITSEYDIATDSEGESIGEFENYMSTPVTTPVNTPAQTPTKLPEVTLVPQTPDLFSDSSHSRQATNKLERPWRTNSRGISFQTMPRRYVITVKPKFLPQLKVIDFHLRAIHELNENDPLNNLPPTSDERERGIALYEHDQHQLTSHSPKARRNLFGVSGRKRRKSSYTNDERGESVVMAKNTEHNPIATIPIVTIESDSPRSKHGDGGNTSVEGIDCAILGEPSTSTRTSNNEPANTQNGGTDKKQQGTKQATTGVQTAQPTPSSSGAAKKSTKTSDPEQPQAKKPQHLPQSSTETTSTSSSPPAPTTSPVQSIESYTFFHEPILELQRRIARYNLSATQQDLLPISSVLVYANSYRLEFLGPALRDT
ncbi:hypothetical protein PR048_031916 [Dryococelus australis]|uniref:Uncharacterized protein n=1 Tax=Dryococelus australis TaxID=614101 RepID=A0ABQ9G9F4_9NEOP|nr:hypothetical protein PR048_031916 [Dryococelus australis]